MDSNRRLGQNNLRIFYYICTLFDKRWGVAAVGWLRQSLFLVTLFVRRAN